VPVRFFFTNCQYAIRLGSVKFLAGIHKKTYGQSDLAKAASKIVEKIKTAI